MSALKKSRNRRSLVAVALYNVSLPPEFWSNQQAFRNACDVCCPMHMDEDFWHFARQFSVRGDRDTLIYVTQHLRSHALRLCSSSLMLSTLWLLARRWRRVAGIPWHLRSSRRRFVRTFVEAFCRGSGDSIQHASLPRASMR